MPDRWLARLLAEGADRALAAAAWKDQHSNSLPHATRAGPGTRAMGTAQHILPFLGFWSPCLHPEVQQEFQNVGEQEKKKRALYPACLYFIMYLCGNGRGVLGHHFVSGLKCLFSINRKVSQGEC